MTLARSWFGCPSCTYPRIHLFMALALKDGPSGTGPCTHVVDSFVRTAKICGELWARPPVLTPVPSQAIHSSPPIAVGSRRVRLSRNLHACFDSLVRLPRDISEKLAFMLKLLGLAFRNSNEERIEKKKTCVCLSLSGSLALVVRTWRHGDTSVGQDARDNQHVRQQRDGEM